MENLSTRQWAERIGESLTNGQRKQARVQFIQARADHCEAYALLNDIADVTDRDQAITLAASIIENL